MEFSTVWPIAVLVLMSLTYNVVKRVRPGSAFANRDKWMYSAFLLIFLVFPTNSTYVFRYFNCIKFDAADEDPSKLKVLMADMSINCRSARPRREITRLACPTGDHAACFLRVETTCFRAQATATKTPRPLSGSWSRSIRSASRSFPSSSSSVTGAGSTQKSTRPRNIGK